MLDEVHSTVKRSLISDINVCLKCISSSLSVSSIEECFGITLFNSGLTIDTGECFSLQNNDVIT